MQRVDVLRRIVADAGADAAVVTDLADVRWLCGFSGSNGLLVVTTDGATLVTDGRYRVQAALEVNDAEVAIASGPLFKHVSELNLLAKAEHILFQHDALTVKAHRDLTAAAPSAEFIGRSRLLAEHRARKSPFEIDAIRRAQKITDTVFGELLSIIREGMTEAELSAEIVYRHLRLGAERMAFEPIVASGPNGALPHARPSARRLQRGDLVVLDFGCVIDGYASDMTRTISIGEPADQEATRVYDVVVEALLRSTAEARAGVEAVQLDTVARDVIGEAGYGEYFQHGLGHGVGLETHEWPRVSHNAESVIPEHSVVTLEPGVYLPGRFGVRVEDLVVVGQKGADVLTTSTKELIRV